MSRRRLRLLVTVPLLAVPLSACSFSIGGTDSLPADEVADGAEDALEDQVGVRPDVSCPENLEAEVDAETRCMLTVDGDPEEYGVTVIVTSVEDDTASFDVQVDEEPVE